jgi:hypothetical protein
MKKAEQNRDKGIARAVNHAEAIMGDWFDKASVMMLLFMKQNPGKAFMAEQVRAWAEDCGMPKPPDNRAWGGVFISASKANVIRSIGYKRQESATCHCSPKNVWKKA